MAYVDRIEAAAYSDDGFFIFSRFRHGMVNGNPPREMLNCIVRQNPDAINRAMWKKIKAFLFYNRTTRQTIAKNTFWLAVSNFGGRLLRAVVIIYGARILGASEYGLFSYAITLSAFVSIFVD